MKRILRFPLFVFIALFTFFLAGCQKGQAAPPAVMEGDILFQITTSPQSKAIQMATASQYTHCGLILKKDGKLQVFEAGSKIGWVPLEEWIKRGVKGHYVQMRLKDTSVLTPDVMKVMHKEAGKLAGKDYDLLFQWSDTAIYCSELVWKIYQRATGLELGKLKTFAEYDLNHDIVRKIIKERYGKDFNPHEKVIAPSDLMKSGLLTTVAKN